MSRLLRLQREIICSSRVERISPNTTYCLPIYLVYDMHRTKGNGIIRVSSRNKILAKKKSTVSKIRYYHEEKILVRVRDK